MKKMLCFLLCLTLIFSSVSLCFAADWSSSDSQNLANAAGRLYYMNQSAAYYLYNIASNTNNIYNKCVDIYNALFNSGHNVAYWLSSIDSFMSPIFQAIQQTPLDLEKIYYSLGTTYNSGGSTVYRPFLSDIKSGLFDTFSGTSSFTTWNNNTDTTNWSTFNWVSSGNIFQQLMFALRATNNNSMGYYVKSLNAQFGNYNLPRSGLNWTDLSAFSHTASSQSEGQNYWLSMIQQPVARLSYVLASDERIAAQEAAAANEEAVVDNFIDSSGNGSASPSDIGSVSNLSSGYKQNFGSDASVSGIFNIFDSNNMGWFSQETKNQLDTTTPTRLTKGSESETPLLDKQIKEIYDALGVKQP